MASPSSPATSATPSIRAWSKSSFRANRLAPLDAQPQVTDTVHDTELVFGALMSGSQVTPKPGLVPIEVIETMLRLMAQTVQQIAQSGGVGDWQKVNGLANCELYTKAFVLQFADDPADQIASDRP